MTPEQALEYKRKGGKLYEPMDFNSNLVHNGPLQITHIPAVAQGGPGDDSGRIAIPSHHFRTKAVGG